MRNIFDSHAHYDSEAFNDDRKELVSALPEQGVCGVINCASDIASSLTSLELADEFDFVYAACGVHPHEAAECNKGYLPVLKKLCNEEKCVAVGEIGLDYHYDFSPRDIQLQIFEQQIVLAKELDLPITFPDRDAQPSCKLHGTRSIHTQAMSGRPVFLVMVISVILSIVLVIVWFVLGGISAVKEIVARTHLEILDGLI